MSCMSPNTHVSPAKYTLFPSARTTMPHGSPMYAPSLFELEWCAFVIVKRTSSTATVPPLFGSSRFSTPCVPSQYASLTVRDGDHVDLLRRHLALGAFRIAVEERIDVDALARRVEAERGVSEPCEFHSPSLNVKDRPMRPRTFAMWSHGSSPWDS